MSDSISHLPTPLTRSGTRRRGDEYQDVQALDALVEWLEHNDRYHWVQLEADQSGFLDDLMVLRADGVLEGWQVKFSTKDHQGDDAWTWAALLAQDDGKKGPKDSLLQRWFKTWVKSESQKTPFSPGLLSNRKAAPELCLNSPRDGQVVWDEVPKETRALILAQWLN